MSPLLSCIQLLNSLQSLFFLFFSCFSSTFSMQSTFSSSSSFFFHHFNNINVACVFQCSMSPFLDPNVQISSQNSWREFLLPCWRFPPRFVVDSLALEMTFLFWLVGSRHKRRILSFLFSNNRQSKVSVVVRDEKHLQVLRKQGPLFPVYWKLNLWKWVCSLLVPIQRLSTVPLFQKNVLFLHQLFFCEMKTSHKNIQKHWNKMFTMFSCNVKHILLDYKGLWDSNNASIEKS
jgi:hypothetical protein